MPRRVEKEFYLPPYNPEEDGKLTVFDGLEGYTEVEQYWVNEPYAFIVILYNENKKEYLYYVAEPKLTSFEKTLLERIYEDLLDVLTLEKDENKKSLLTQKVLEIVGNFRLRLAPESLYKLLYYIQRNYIGFKRIDALIRDPFIEDISCDGTDVPIFLYHRRYQNIKTNIVFSEKHLDSFIINIAQQSGKHISIGNPLVNATMPDGSRLQASLGREVTLRGGSFTIRKFREEPFTPVDLIDFNTFPLEAIAYLWLAIENNRSLIFVGGTASGKTSSLNAVSLFIPPMSKIVTIEDTHELTLHHENWIASITRESFAKGGEGEIGMYELLRQALRQRPEYMIVGEVRGSEALTLFQAMSTGHTTYSTMHAGSVEEAISRLENDPINVPRAMLQSLNLMSIQIMTYVGGKRVRRAQSIVEFLGFEPGSDDIRINEVFRWDPVSDTYERPSESYILRDIMEQRGWSWDELDMELLNRHKILEYMVEREIRNYKDFSSVVQSYFTNPDAVLEEIEGMVCISE
ncbi:MAG: type II/IV secretion system ATPase subunit [Halobacteriota archaeon]|nr:type II/IV secretion system ATPase subunit [Halobacteriota archaeon]